MEFFKKKTNVDFLGLRKCAAILSLSLLTLSLISLGFHGLKKGLDFTGGTQIQLSFLQQANIPLIRQELETKGFKDAVVQSYGTSHEAIITLPTLPEKTTHALLSEEILSVLPTAQIKSMEFIGPQVGKELVGKGILAVITALIAIMIYITLRFEYRFAIGAAIALIHDPILILGLFSLFHVEFNLTALAAVLAVLGYSLNDTIVIFDRIRENFRKIRKGSTTEIVNLSINQTLSRTIMTSATTLVVVICLFIFGGPMLHSFALALMIGMVIGTYSSIYVSGALAVSLGIHRLNLIPKVKSSLDDRP